MQHARGVVRCALFLASLAPSMAPVAIAGAPPPPPTITTFSPTSAPVGSPVAITGTGFAGATSVTFDGWSATFTVTSGISITAIVPANATTGLLSVTTPGGTATGTRFFSVVTSCTQAIDPTTAGFAASGGSASATVTAPPDCSWTTGWIGRGLTVTAGASGTGNGTVTYSLAPNTGAGRDVTVLVGGRPFTVHQSGWLNDAGAGLVGVESPSAAWGDYDNDGDLDILLTGYNTDLGDIAKVYRNDGGGSFTDVAAELPGVHFGAVAWGDYDNDDDLDILLTGSSGVLGPVAMVYRNDLGVFTDVAAGLAGVSSSSAAWGDYDHDGDADILLTGWDGIGPLARVYRNDGGSVFTVIQAGLTGVAVGAAAWGDYDGDDDLDILLTGRSGSGPVAKVYRNDGGGFTEVAAGLTGVEFSSVAWGDYDGDDDLDILLVGRSGADNSSDVSIVYRNDGGGAFTDIHAGLAPTEGSSAIWGDYDNDGDLDILLNSVPDATLYRNDGGGVFTDTELNLPGTQGSLVWGDYDDDGDLDALLTGWNGFEVAQVYRANTDPGSFFSLTPCRLADTRNAAGTLGGPSLVAGADRFFRLFEQCRIPPTARAVSVNLTVMRPTVAGNLRLYPANIPRPAIASINYAAGQTRANNAVAALSGLGELTVHCAQASGTAHFVLDVTGYFE